MEDIRNDALILKGGGLRKILLVSGINFELRSEDEQNVALSEFQSFLNSLDFPLQIFIHSRKVNIEGYAEELGAMQGREGNTLLASLLGGYRDFIVSLVKENAIMEKRFFAVVPYDPFSLPSAGKAVFQKITGLFGKKPIEDAKDPKKITAIPEADFIQLNERALKVANGLSSIGLRALPLVQDELVELFYNLYHPETLERHVVDPNNNE